MRQRILSQTQKGIFNISSVLLATFFTSTSLNAATLELALLIDGSGSIAPVDFATQLDAYQSVFTDVNFFSNFVEPSDFDSLVVSAYQFGSFVNQEIPFTVIDDQASATAFGNQFTFSQIGGGTPMSTAINTATNGILNNAFGGGAEDSSVIDISTDGSPNSTFATTNAAANAQASGIDSLNALAVGPFANETFLETIVFGPGFVETANTFADYEEALEDKLEAEITNGNGNGNGTPIPEPSSIISLLALVSLGTVFKFQRRLSH